MRWEYTIRFGDTDPFGVVYYVSFFKIAHQAVEDYLRSKNIDPSTFFRNEQGGKPIVSASARFLKPVRYPETISVDVMLKGKTTHSLTFQCTFFKNIDKVAEVEMTFVSIDKNWKKKPLSDTDIKLEGKDR